MALLALTQQYWNKEANHPKGYRLTLNAVDGVVWRTPDTPDNANTFAKQRNQHGGKDYPSTLQGGIRAPTDGRWRFFKDRKTVLRSVGRGNDCGRRLWPF